MPAYEVIIKRVEPQTVASVRGVTPNYEEIGPIFDGMFDRLFGYVCGQGIQRVGPGMALYHQATGPDDRSIPIEAAAPLYERLQPGDGVEIYELPGAEQMASVVHQGPFSTLRSAYAAIAQWIDTSGYQIAGPCREIYLQYERGGDQNEYVTEIQFPVVKA